MASFLILAKQFPDPKMAAAQYGSPLILIDYPHLQSQISQPTGK